MLHTLSQPSSVRDPLSTSSRICEILSFCNLKGKLSKYWLNIEHLHNKNGPSEYCHNFMCEKCLQSYKSLPALQPQERKQQHEIAASLDADRLSSLQKKNIPVMKVIMAQFHVN